MIPSREKLLEVITCIMKMGNRKCALLRLKITEHPKRQFVMLSIMQIFVWSGLVLSNSREFAVKKNSGDFLNSLTLNIRG